MKVKSESEVAQVCPTLSDPMDCSLPGSSIHGILQARVLEWGAIAFSVNTAEDPKAGGPPGAASCEGRSQPLSAGGSHLASGIPWDSNPVLCLSCETQDTSKGMSPEGNPDDRASWKPG